jgi:hypothetical protein
VIKSYETGNGTFITSYGQVSTSTSTIPFVGTTDSAGKDVDNPPFEDRIYTLALGQSITQTETVVSTTTLPSPSGPTTNATVSTTRYAADETISVLGKSYATCRYEVFDISAPTEITTLWYIVGKGIPAKIGTSADGLVFQLKSGTYKGSPL